MYPAKVSEDIHLAKAQVIGGKFFCSRRRKHALSLAKRYFAQAKACGYNTIQARFRADNWLRLLKDIHKDKTLAVIAILP